METKEPFAKVQIDDNFSFPLNEEEIIKYWKDHNIYQKMLDKNKGGEKFNFVDGPPFVSSENLHYGHIHVSCCKSSILNYYTMNGYNVLNKLGYDVHGLPSEQSAMKMLGIKTTQEVRQLGIDKFNSTCKDMIKKYAGSWRSTFDRIGRFVDYDNEYKTMDLNFMESVWAVFKLLWEKELVYKGFKIMPYSTACSTPLSNFEASGDSYKEIDDPAIYVKFKLLSGEFKDCYVIVWTTTPWTLPSNLALCVNSTIEYTKIKDKTTEEYYIIAKDSIKNLYPDNKKNKTTLYNIEQTITGDVLVGCIYEPIYHYYSEGRTFKILSGKFVDATSGTGIVHLAPAFGQDDYDVCIENKICTIEQIGQFCPVDENGKFTDHISEYKGLYFRDVNENIIKDLKEKKIIIKKEQFRHNYPFCWRTDTPLIYKAVSSFFIKVTAIKDQLVENNKKINWIPENIGSGRFHQWLDNVKDWGVSRSRFFGTPIPVWMSDDGKEMICIGSVAELKELADIKDEITDIHPEFVNCITIKSKKTGNLLKRVDDVFDCWFESGAVPYGQLHYPFENSDLFSGKDYLSDFICEGLDQTRGWFYTLMVLSTALFNKPAFKNVICTGLILAPDGQKFAKRLGNYIPPDKVFNGVGADALRLYLISSPAVRAESFKFNEDDIGSVWKKLFQLFNGFKFFLEHSTRFTKNGHKFDIDAYKRSTNVMDIWILARVRTALLEISNSTKEFKLYKIYPEVMKFIEDLTNWYIKFNRNRLKGRNCTTEEQIQTLSTLYQTFLAFTKIIAPFVPFLSETLYQKLKVVLPEEQQLESVFLCKYPTETEFPSDEIIEQKMKRLQQISGMVRTLRTQSKQSESAKVPINYVTICTDNNKLADSIREFERYFREEINSINIKYSTMEGLVDYKIITNPKILGKKYRSNANKIKSALEALDSKTVQKILDEKYNTIDIMCVDGNVISIPTTDFETTVISRTCSENELTITEKDVLVIANFEHTQEVKDMYMMRLFVKTVQDMRKNSKLRPWNVIKIYYETDNVSMIRVLQENNEQIVEELIYNIYPMTECECTDKEKLVAEKECLILDINIRIRIILD